MINAQDVVGNSFVNFPFVCSGHATPLLKYKSRHQVPVEKSFTKNGRRKDGDSAVNEYHAYLFSWVETGGVCFQKEGLE